MAAAAAVRGGGRHPGRVRRFIGIRFKSLEGTDPAPRTAHARALLRGLLESGDLPAGLMLTLPKVTTVAQGGGAGFRVRTPGGLARPAERAPSLRGAGRDAPSSSSARTAPRRSPRCSTARAAGSPACTTEPTTTAHPRHLREQTSRWSTRRPITPSRSCRSLLPRPVFAFPTVRPTCCRSASARPCSPPRQLHARPGAPLARPGLLPGLGSAREAAARAGSSRRTGSTSTAWTRACARIRDYIEHTESGFLDEPATARALAGFVGRAVACGAAAADGRSRDGHRCRAAGAAGPTLEGLDHDTHLLRARRRVCHRRARLLTGRAVVTEAYTGHPARRAARHRGERAPGMEQDPHLGPEPAGCRWVDHVRPVPRSRSQPGGGSSDPEPEEGVECSLFLLSGSLTVTLAGERHELSPGGFAYVPAATQRRGRERRHRGGRLPVGPQGLSGAGRALAERDRGERTGPRAGADAAAPTAPGARPGCCPSTISPTTCT